MIRAAVGNSLRCCLGFLDQHPAAQLSQQSLLLPLDLMEKTKPYAPIIIYKSKLVLHRNTVVKVILRMKKRPHMHIYVDTVGDRTTSGILHQWGEMGRAQIILKDQMLKNS